MSDHATLTAERETATPVHAAMLIGGERVAGGARLEVRNPARPSELVGTVPRGTPNDVDRAVAAALTARPAWSRLRFVDRADILRDAIAGLGQDIEARARLFVRENGKTLAEATAELSGLLRRQPLALSHAASLDEGRDVPGERGDSRVEYRPYGVVASIVPWNAPVSLAFTQIVAALLAGNSVVLKPPESCPLALIATAELFAAVLPAGVLNIVTGLPGEIGDALTGHRDIAKIGFTGSVGAARRILAVAARSIKPTTMELGGNDPAILLHDAAVDDATVAALRTATFQMAGQVCMAVKRIYVPRSSLDRFIDRFAGLVDATIVGDGLDPRIGMGPVHTAAAAARCMSLVDDAVARGARAMTLGKLDPRSSDDGGYFVRPTIVRDVPETAPLMVEEQFGPVIPVAGYDDLDEVVERANDTVFGLSASLWGRDRDALMKTARRLDVGQVWLNAHGPPAVNHNAPYGGVKQSGMGRKSGIEGVLEYLQSQTITEPRLATEQN